MSIFATQIIGSSYFAQQPQEQLGKTDSGDLENLELMET